MTSCSCFKCNQVQLIIAGYLREQRFIVGNKFRDGQWRIDCCALLDRARSSQYILKLSCHDVGRSIIGNGHGKVVIGDERNPFLV
jgi:hypothetical protein